MHLSFLTALHRLLPSSGAGVCVALSGGLDSVVLLHLLHAARPSLDLRLSALHVHHGLSPNADHWTAFCAELCARLAVPLTVERVQVDGQAGWGIEAAARQARYGTFGRCGAEYIALAHHRDDQAETLLLNLLRGAGVQGAAGMPAARELLPGGPVLLRPLLEVPRSDILAWAREEGLAWIEDESNADTRYRRNFLRQTVLPALKERFPGSDAALARAAGHFGEAAELLAELAERDLAAVRDGEALLLPPLAALAPPRRRNLLRHWLARRGLAMPDAARLEEVLCQMLATAPDAAPAVDLAPDLALRRFRGRLHLVLATPPPMPAPWQGEPALPWAGGQVRFCRLPGQGFRDALAQGPWRLEPRRGGERLRVHPSRPSRSLKKLLQESELPPWQRETLPCLWCGDELVWVAGLGVAVGWQCEAGGEGWLPEWQPSPAQVSPAGRR